VNILKINSQVSINERIQRLVDDFENGNQKAFSDKLGVAPSSLNGIVGARQSDPSSKILNKILDVYANVNAEWLLMGKEPMLKVESNSIYRENDHFDQIEEDGIRIFSLKTDHKRAIQRVPLYDFEAVAGLVPLFKDSSKQEPVDYIQIPNLPKCDGAIYVVGDSMYPLLKSGDIVLYKWVKDMSNCIFWGEMYLVSVDFDGEEYVTVKYIQKSENDGFIRLVSYNQHHSDRDVPLSNVRAMAFVKASIRINSMK
jgi:phage repressor protein C with HTH and peptisase S24 domain